MKTRLLLPLILLLLATMSRVVAAGPTVVPVYKEPRHRLVYAKGNIHIIDVGIPPGDTSMYHRHQNPTLFVMLQGARMRNQNLGEAWTNPTSASSVKAGTFVFNNYHTRPQTHRVQNVDDHTFRTIGVINSGPGSNDPTTLSQKPEVDNRWFNGYRFWLAPGATTRVQHHKFPVLVVQVGAGHTDVIERGYPIDEKTVAGAWSIHAAGVAIALHNMGKAKVELVEIEMK